MNKAAIASLFALSAFVPATGTIFSAGTLLAQTPDQPAGQVTMDPAEFTDYDNAMNKQTTPATQAPALEAYLAKYPKSTVKNAVLQKIMLDYSGVDPAKAVAAADNYLAVVPNDLQAYVIEALLRKQMAEAQTDPAAKQAGLDSAATFAKKGLDLSNQPKPATMDQAQFDQVKSFGVPNFYATIGEDDLTKKDGPGAIAAYKAELAAMKPDQLSTPAALQETYYLGQAYYISTPPDYVNCAFYTTRAASLAPDQFKPVLQPLANYCYKKAHGNMDGYDAVIAAAKASPDPKSDFAIKAPPTDKEIADQLMSTTADADIPKLATGDKEFVLANASPDNAAKVWDAVKGKSVEIPGALVIESSDTVVKVAVSDDAVQAKKADFTFNLKPIEEPKTKSPVATKAYEKKKADIAAAIAVGKTVTLDGTYSSYTPSPIMIIMDDGEVVLPKAAPAAPHRAPARH